ncbi:MAG: hypothetical protein JW771_04225, partial [Candidatus Thermoplasmatota archaeon]|nr:hypothetical protein [Candidatus Thermoplasmatota archaeon]
LNLMGEDYRITSAVLHPDETLDLQLDAIDAPKIINLSGKLDGGTTGSEVYVNGELIEDAGVTFVGSTAGGTLRLDSLFYVLFADGTLGDVFVPKGERLSAHLDEPEGLFGLDVQYGGLSQEPTVIFRIDSVGNDEFDLEFTNNEGIFFDTPLASNDVRAPEFKWGDHNDDLCFRDGEFVSRQDYFIVNDPATNFTHVLRYDNIDTSNCRLTFTDLGTGTREISYNPTTNEGRLVIAGSEFKVTVDDAHPYDLKVDLNADGIYTLEPVKIYGQHGLVISFDEDGSAKYVDFTIPGSKIDTGIDETVRFAIRPVPGNTIETALVDGVSLYRNEVTEQHEGMTRYGNHFFQYQGNSDVTVTVPARQLEATVEFYGNQ